MTARPVAHQATFVSGLDTQQIFAPAVVQVENKSLSFSEYLLRCGVPTEIVPKIEENHLFGHLTDEAKDVIVEIVASWDFDTKMTNESLSESAQSLQLLVESLPSMKKFVGERKVQSDIITGKFESAQGIFPCPRCKQKNTGYSMGQTRSSDEAMTTFLMCYSCMRGFKIH